MAQLLSLEGVERQILVALHGRCLLVFYSHRQGGFVYFNQEDGVHIRAELTNLRTAYRDGRITAARAGDPITVNGAELHTMELTFDVPCVPYMLLRRRGRREDADHTPYFFVHQDARDEALESIRAPAGGGRQNA